jgi:hypothetical protein
MAKNETFTCCYVVVVVVVTAGTAYMDDCIRVSLIMVSDVIAVG